MKTYVRMRDEKAGPLPAELADDDVRFPPALVELFLAEHSRPGDMVFDPFAGFGTTLWVAERMGRRARGLELDARRYAYARTLLTDPEALINGDARRLSTYSIPQIDCL